LPIYSYFVPFFSWYHSPKFLDTPCIYTLFEFGALQNIR
jgi:hypothetical protein